MSGLNRKLALIVGATGMGKSTLARWMIGTTGPASALILDTAGQSPDALSARGFASQFQDAGTLRAFVLAAHKERIRSWRAALVPHYMKAGPAANYLAELAEWIGNTWLVYEEAADYATDTAIKQGKLNALVHVMKQGRHRCASVIGLSQRPVDIAPTLRSELQSGEAWYFQLAEDRDLATLAARRGAAFADAVMRLPKGRALRIVGGTPRDVEPERWAVEWRNGAPHVERIG